MAWDKDLDKNGVAYNMAAAEDDRIRVTQDLELANRTQ